MDDRPLPKWQTIYRVLHQDGRIWEARDLIEALLEVIGPRDLLAHLFPLSHDSIREYGDDLVNVYLNMLLQQWDAASTGLQSESKLLALMSIFTNLAMEFSRIFDTRRWGPASLIMAREAAEKLVAQHGAHNIYTRPFLRFLVVEAMMASLISSNDVLHNMLFESGARGETVYEYGLGFPSYLLPLYEPSEAETPIWAPRRNEEVIKILHTVFGSAEQMGDAGLQIGCLTQLIMYGEHDAVRLVDDLGRLYLEAGNFVGQRNSLLFSYLLARTKEEKKALRGLILESGRYVFRENDNFTRDKILEALEDQGHVEHGLNERPLRRRRYMNEYDDDDSDDDFSDYSLEYEDRSYSHPPPPRIRKSDSQHYAPSSSPPPPRPIPIKTGSDVVQQYIPVSDYYPRKSAPPVRRRPTSFGPDNNSFSYGVGPLVIYDKHKSRPSRHSTSYYDEDNYGEIHEPDKDRVRTVNSDELEEISRRGRDDGQDMIVRRSDVSRSRSRATKAYATLQPTAEQVYLDGLDARAHRFEEMADPEKDAARNEVIREVHRHEEARREDETSRSEEAPGDEPWRKEARLQALREQERRMDTERQEATSLGQTPPDIESLPEAEREAIRKDIEAHEDAVATYVRRETDERANGHTIDSTGSAAALATIAEEVPNGRTTASESVDD